MRIETQMRTAFLNARVSRSADPKGSIISAAGTALRVGAGVRDVPGWNAHLSKRTYDSLKKAGVMQ